MSCAESFSLKKTESLRLFVDNRKLNAITRHDSYSIPRMHKCINSLGTAALFSTLDANNGDWQLRFEETTYDRAAFTFYRELQRLVRMPFKLKNAPKPFQLAMNVLRTPVKLQFALAYFNSIVVFLSLPLGHINHVKRVFSFLHGVEITLKLNKCIFITRTFDFLGLVTRPRHLEIATHLAEALKGIKSPTKIVTFCSLIVLCNSFRRFVPNSTRIVAPLNIKLKEDHSAHFSAPRAEKLRAMHKLQEKLVSTPILTLSSSIAEYTLDTDSGYYRNSPTKQPDQLGTGCDRWQKPNWLSTSLGENVSQLFSLQCCYNCTLKKHVLLVEQATIH